MKNVKVKRHITGERALNMIFLGNELKQKFAPPAASLFAGGKNESQRKEGGGGEMIEMYNMYPFLASIGFFLPLIAGALDFPRYSSVHIFISVKQLQMIYTIYNIHTIIQI